MLRSTRKHEAVRKQLAADVKAFTDGGGKVTECDRTDRAGDSAFVKLNREDARRARRRGSF